MPQWPWVTFLLGHLFQLLVETNLQGSGQGSSRKQGLEAFRQLGGLYIQV